MSTPTIATLPIYRHKHNEIEGVATNGDGTPLDCRGILRLQARRELGDDDAVIDKQSSDFIITGAAFDHWYVIIFPEDTAALPGDRLTHLKYEVQAASDAENAEAIAIGDMPVFPTAIGT